VGKDLTYPNLCRPPSSPSPIVTVNLYSAKAFRACLPVMIYPLQFAQRPWSQMYAFSPERYILTHKPRQARLSSGSAIRSENIWKKCPCLELVSLRCIRPIACFRPWKIWRFGRRCQKSTTPGRGYRTGCRGSHKGGWPLLPISISAQETDKQLDDEHEAG